MTKTKTIVSVAKEMLDNMEWSKRDDDSKFVKCTKDIEWQRDIIYKAHFEGERLPDDDIYERIYYLLVMFVECETEEEAQDRIYEAETDVYTHDLLKWLSSNLNNVYYLTEILEECDVKDGF